MKRLILILLLLALCVPSLSGQTIKGTAAIKGKAAAGTAAGAFSPDDISGLVLWLKADAIIGLNDNDPVTTWEDSSAANNDATQATAGKKPLYKTAVLNSLPVLRFDATDDGMETNVDLSALPYTLFIVYSYRSAVNTSRRAIQGANNWLIGPYSNTHQMYNGAFITGPAVTQNVFVLACARQASGDAQFFVDGTSAGTNAQSGAVGTRLIMGFPNSATNPPFNEGLDGDIAEIIAYNSSLSSTDRDSVEAYIASKYGLTIAALPLMWPYRFAHKFGYLAA